ncbi:MAG TPA: hypothetical protein VK421_10760 [Pyrinomonadaceae bacterium]|nr:hypothetical protein [Pyrinomonadaceae bacterium]
MGRRQLWRRAVSLCLAFTILGVHTARGVAPGTAAPAGGLDVSGRVTVDGQDTLPGATFFSGGRIETADDSEATISLGELGRVRYDANSAGVLSFAEAATSGRLEGGRVTVSKPGGVTATFSTKDGTVAADVQEAAVFSIDVTGDGTVVSSLSGRVRLQAAGGGRELAPGESATFSQGGGTTQDDDDGLSNEKKAAIIVALGAVAAVVIILLARDDDEAPPQISPSQ